MKRSIFLFFTVLFLAQNSYGYNYGDNEKDRSNTPKVITIIETPMPPKIDGKLNDEAWEKATVVNEFIQSSPNPGETATEQTKVKIIYDTENIYVAAKIDVTDYQEVFKNLTLRDVSNQSTDIFSIEFDTYHDLINSFIFTVTAAGVQVDGRRSGGIDFNWNAIWDSEVVHTANGWQAEIKIPFSALRFPDKENQEWGVRFYRSQRKKDEKVSWPFIDYNNDNIVRQFATLKGIKKINSPIRLALLPYTSGKVEHHTSDGIGSVASVGMDVKYGINDAFTLDMTLVPDFSQVAQDNQVLNLSTQEVQFAENRPFFTEGVELFNKSNLFYSRRIGGRPLGYYRADDHLNDGEKVISNPKTSQMINAFKVTGRTTEGTGIGFFNAVTKPTYAKIGDRDGTINRSKLTAPLTNYGVLVIDQNLKGGTNLNFTGTNVFRSGNWEDVSAGSVGGSVLSKKGKYAFDFQGQAVHKSNKPDNKSDFSSFLGFRKAQGNFTFSLRQFVVGKEFDPNDLGFSRFINFQQFGVYTKYKDFEPTSKKMRYYHFTTFVRHERLLSPNIHTGLNFGASSNIQWSNFWRTTFELSFWNQKNDFYDTGIDGQHIQKPGGQTGALILTSDRRKKLQFWGRLRLSNYNIKDGGYKGIAIKPTVVVNDKVSLNWLVDYRRSNNEIGTIRSNRSVVYHNNDIIVGRRNLETVEQELGFNVLFTNKIGMSINCRHYWAGVKQNSYYALEADGSQTKTEYLGIDTTGMELHNSNFNAFTVNAPLTWQFAPGSELSLVWQNNLAANKKEAVKNYFSNLNSLFDSIQSNSFSLRMTYYLDYYETKCKLFDSGC